MSPLLTSLAEHHINPKKKTIRPLYAEFEANGVENAENARAALKGHLYLLLQSYLFKVCFG